MSIKLKGSTDGSVTLQAPADTSPTGTDKTFTLPTADGTNGQVLQTNGSGTLSFASSYDNSPLFHGFQTANNTIAHNTLTEITSWSTTEDDPDNVFANGRFTPTVAGRYLLIAGADLSAANKRIRYKLFLYKNGYSSGTKLSESEFTDGSAGTKWRFPLHTSALVSLNGSTDYVSLYADVYEYTSVGNTDLQNATFSIIRVGD